MKLVLALAAAATALVPVLAKPTPVRVVTVTATDYAFRLPDTIVAGRTRLDLVNKGTELHHIALARLEQGRTMADLHRAMRAGGPPPPWLRDVGGPNTPVPGGTSSAVLDLAPGTYVLLCMIPSPDGMPHVMKGMMKPLTVVAPARGTAAATVAVATPDIEVRLTDYAFAWSTPLTAGTHVIRVTNLAEQPHEIIIARLAPGRTAGELAAWIDKMDGPPPAMPMGGTTGMAKGVWNDIIVDLPPGEYALLCFIPDAGDGKPHVAHGMMQQLMVR